MTNPWSYALYIGFYAGLIWGLAGFVMYLFDFTELRPAFWIAPWADKAFQASWRGYLAGLAAYVALSMLAALLYAAVLRKAHGPWPGILYGFGWYLLLFLLIGPSCGMVPAFTKLEVQTLLSEMCRFLLWGVFIGYSITLEFTDERIREPNMG